MNPELLRALLKGWRAGIKPAYRPRTSVPKTDMQFPKSVERQYARMLSRLFHAYTDPVLADLPAVLAQSLRKDGLHVDSPIDDLSSDMESLDTRIYYDFIDVGTYGGIYKGVEATISAYGWDANTFNQKQWRKFLGMALPDAFPLSEPWVNSAIDQWSKLNATLVDADAGKFFAKVETVVRNAVMTGRRAESVMNDLRAEQETLTGNRAKFIARNEIGNLNALLTKERNQAAGIDQYTWATSMDERVRGRPMGKWEYSDTSHWLMEGKRCRWDDPTVYSDDGVTWLPRSSLRAVVTQRKITKTGTNGTPGKAGAKGKSKVVSPPNLHPSQDYNCRCGSRAFLGDLIAELDAELKEAGL